jgi:hypothetical protein
VICVGASVDVESQRLVRELVELQVEAILAPEVLPHGPEVAEGRVCKLLAPHRSTCLGKLVDHLVEYPVRLIGAHTLNEDLGHSGEQLHFDFALRQWRESFAVCIRLQVFTLCRIGWL